MLFLLANKHTADKISNKISNYYRISWKSFFAETVLVSSHFPDYFFIFFSLSLPSFLLICKQRTDSCCPMHRGHVIGNCHSGADTSAGQCMEMESNHQNMERPIVWERAWACVGGWVVPATDRRAHPHTQFGLYNSYSITQRGLSSLE